MPRFPEKAVIITGSSYGIGRSAALLFAQEGASVTITGRNSERLQETRQLLLKSGVPEKNVNLVVADVTEQNGQDQLIKTTLDKFGKIDILVNNAGAAIADDTGAIGTDQTMDTYHKTLQLNLQAVIEMTKKAKPHLIASKGEIVNVSSIVAGPQAQPEFVYYAIAKAALDQYTRSTAIDLIQYGVRVNSVSPGVVATGFVGAMGMDNQASQKFYEFMSSRKECIPARVAGHPEDIAYIILFLADRKMSSYIIGQSIVADGYISNNWFQFTVSTHSISISRTQNIVLPLSNLHTISPILSHYERHKHSENSSCTLHKQRVFKLGEGQFSYFIFPNIHFLFLLQL